MFSMIKDENKLKMLIIPPSHKEYTKGGYLY